jgi:hypothetical protein
MSQAAQIRQEGIAIGILGASTVALWFLLVDVIAGVALATPVALGAAMFGVDPAGLEGAWLGVFLGYTAFHYISFILVGLLASYSTRLAERRPEFLALFVVLFVVFQVGFYGLTAVLHMTYVLGSLTWYQIAVGNLLATAVMGGYLWRAHPRIKDNLALALAR